MLYNPERLKVGMRVRCDDPELMWDNQTGIVVSKDDASIFVKLDDGGDIEEFSIESLVEIK